MDSHTPATTPIFTHDCTTCIFMGHFFGHDVYRCPVPQSSPLGPSIVARYGDEGPDYASSPPASIILAQIKGNEPIGIGGCGTLPMHDFYMKYADAPDYMRAWLMAFAIYGLEHASYRLEEPSNIDLAK